MLCRSKRTAKLFASSFPKRKAFIFRPKSVLREPSVCVRECSQSFRSCFHCPQERDRVLVVFLRVWVFLVRRENKGIIFSPSECVPKKSEIRANRALPCAVYFYMSVGVRVYVQEIHSCGRIYVRLRVSPFVLKCAPTTSQPRSRNCVP